MVKEIVRVKLENEMDLILAHKRAMKICELTGFSLISQTSIATAVSEIARCAIEFGKNALLILEIESLKGKKFLKTKITDSVDFTQRASEACSYAKRLVDDIEIVRTPKEVQIILKQQLAFGGILSETKIDSFVTYFKNEAPLSAYDELRRKNLLLQDLAEKIRDSETDYRILTDSLPLMMFSVNNRGHITYTNKWLQDFFGTIPKEMNTSSWQAFIYPGDTSRFGKELSAAITRQQAFNGEYRFRERRTGNYLWHMFSTLPLKNEKEMVVRWIGFIVDVHAQKQVDQAFKDNRELKEIQQELFQNQEELQKKIIELNRSNYELEQFAHLASHDLQEPLRKLFFYSDVLKKKYGDKLDSSGVNMLNSMAHAAGRMKELINDLLTYSQLQKQVLQFENVDLNQVIKEIIADLDMVAKEKNATFEVAKLPTVWGNTLRLRQLFVNLISNSLKYCRQDVSPRITITTETRSDLHTISIRDNGIGFDEQYSEKIFGLFERLHTRDQFPGTGIGLSICKRIVELHKGKISASSKEGEYAQFNIQLPVTIKEPVLAEQS